jgi:hypothetical protein
MSNHYQVLVIGGGNAGLSVASKLLIKKKWSDRNRGSFKNIINLLGHL